MDGIFKQMNEVAKSLKAVRMVQMDRFKARNIYMVYNMLQPLLSEHGITISRSLIKETESERVKESNYNGVIKKTIGTHRYQLWKFTLHAIDGSHFSTEFPAESLDWGDKAASQCDAMAHKQMLIHTFLIPTEDKDPDDGPENSAYKESEPFTPVPNTSDSSAISPAQIKRLWAISFSRELSKNQVEKSLFDRYGFDTPSKLNKKQYDQFVSVMEAMPEKTKKVIKNHAPNQ